MKSNLKCCGKHSNIQSFITHTTPSVPIHSLSKGYTRDFNSLWQPIGKDKIEYYILGDLWEQYDEWSVYGAGVPVVLDNSESLVQYYVPYLSAIQIYTTKCLSSPRIMLEESETELFSDDSESEKLSKSWDTGSDDSLFDQDSSCLTKELLGQLYFQYIEHGSPYGRIPLRDKINEFARQYPGLISFRSVDISPASWMSVAWYPIYHIPTWRNIKDLSASFLTYHTLSASFQDDDDAPLKMATDCCYAATNYKNRRNSPAGSEYTDLNPFGLATYRTEGNLWRNAQSSDVEVLSTLYSSAYSWLKQLRVEHHDFDFFTTH